MSSPKPENANAFVIFSTFRVLAARLIHTKVILKCSPCHADAVHI